jgi:hypothetical protein
MRPRSFLNTILSAMACWNDTRAPGDFPASFASVHRPATPDAHPTSFPFTPVWERTAS